MRPFRVWEKDESRVVGDVFLAALAVSPQQLQTAGVELDTRDQPPFWNEAGPTEGAVVELATGRPYILSRPVDHPTLTDVVVVGRDATAVRDQIGALLAALNLEWDAVTWIQEDGVTG